MAEAAEVRVAMATRVAMVAAMAMAVVVPTGRVTAEAVEAVRAVRALVEAAVATLVAILRRTERIGCRSSYGGPPLILQRSCAVCRSDLGCRTT